jgi:hypothetical protein
MELGRLEPEFFFDLEDDTHDSRSAQLNGWIDVREPAIQGSPWRKRGS